MIVRAANAGDVEAIAAVHVAGWQWGYRGQLPDALLDAIAPAQRLALWQRILTNPAADTPVFVVERDGRVAGFVAAGPSRELDAAPADTEIRALYIAQDVAGTPAAHLLLTRALALMPGRRVTLWVLASNDHAQRFYERAGFRADGVTRSEPWQGLELHEVRYVLLVA